MRLANRRPNTAIVFIDQPSGEVLLRVAAGSDGSLRFEFHLYDASGMLIAETPGLESFPQGLAIESPHGETLLNTANEAGVVHYRLYNRDGALLTCSDGIRTQIFPFLRIESEVPRSPPYRKEVRR